MVQQTKHRLDLDALMFEPARIQTQEGAITLRELSGAEVIAFGRQAAEAGQGARETAPLRVADCLAGLAVEPDRALVLLDSVPITALLELVQWVQSMQPPEFVVALPEATSEVVLNGRARAVYPLLLGTYRQTQELAGAQPTVDELAQASATLVASMLADTAPEEILALPYRKQVALQELLGEAVGAAADAVEGALPLPVRPPAARRRTRSGK